MVVLLAAGEFAESFQRQLDRLGAAAGDGDGEEVQQRSLGFVAGALGNVLPPCVGDESGRGLGLRRVWESRQDILLVELDAARDLGGAALVLDAAKLVAADLAGDRLGQLLDELQAADALEGREPLVGVFRIERASRASARRGRQQDVRPWAR
jgi:hypothetical protein